MLDDYEVNMMFYKISCKTKENHKSLEASHSETLFVKQQFQQSSKLTQ
jgi:hypothetical protein